MPEYNRRVTRLTDFDIQVEASNLDIAKKMNDPTLTHHIHFLLFTQVGSHKRT
jgi:hypothetical protein